MQTWKCTACGCIAEEDELGVREVYEDAEFWGAQVRRAEVVTLCPRCGSEDIEEVECCEHCGLNPPVEGGDYCEGCEAEESIT